MKRKICYKAVPGGYEWKLGICKDLLEIRDNEDVQLPGFSLEEIEKLLSFICVSSFHTLHFNKCTLLQCKCM